MQDTREPEGLSSSEAEKRLKEIGPNVLTQPRKISFFSIALEEITEPMILLLLLVGILYSIWGGFKDAITIFVVIILLVLAEVWNEYRAKKSIAALAKLTAPEARVVRDGQITTMRAENVVPGDVLVLTPGTRIAADARLYTSFSLQVDESALTGESLPQTKSAGDEVFAGTLVVAGEGKSKVSATGKNTKFGQISATAGEIRPPRTPLQLSMKDLAKKLLLVAVLFSVLIPLIGILQGKPWRTMILTGLALAFATIPEELPIVITMVLGLGAYMLSRQGFLVKKLQAAEVLGDATVILTDKTGTITENRMRVVDIYPPQHDRDVLQASLAAMTELSASPTDTAVADKAKELGATVNLGPVLCERTFGNGRNTKAVIRSVDGALMLITSGAPEEVLSIVEGDTAQARDQLQYQAAQGRRIIAVAQKPLSAMDKPFSDIEKDMQFVGLIALEDPPRPQVRETINQARRAGIRTIMVTGDHPDTAASIARQVDIPSSIVITGGQLAQMPDSELARTVESASVFARTTPQDKYRLVQALHADHQVVAVTGDGVNDTLALKAADIGIAMGLKGTDAAKEAADVVLANDSFVTIAHGVFEGRKFYDNLQKGIKYYLSVKLALIAVFLLPILFGVPLPFSPIQIILLELFMDLAASSGFVAEPAERNILERPPRNPSERFLGARMIYGISVSGLTLFAAVMIPYFYALNRGLPLPTVQSLAFSAWMLGHVILAYVSRSSSQPLYRQGIWTNKVIDVWAAVVVVVLLVLTQIPSVGRLVSLTQVPPGYLLAVLIEALAVIGWQAVWKPSALRLLICR
jgi:Ca2+-transporting ATPase